MTISEQCSAYAKQAKATHYERAAALTRTHMAAHAEICLANSVTIEERAAINWWRQASLWEDRYGYEGSSWSRRIERKTLNHIWDQVRPSRKLGEFENAERWRLIAHLMGEVMVEIRGELKGEMPLHKLMEERGTTLLFEIGQNGQYAPVEVPLVAAVGT